MKTLDAGVMSSSGNGAKFISSNGDVIINSAKQLTGLGERQMKTKMFKITYKNGLKNDIVVEARNKEDAEFEGLAEFRKGMVFIDYRTADEVIKSIDEVK